ncbi:hypothetical protein [Candidatus Neptunochlamydia vexilliferae]|nr:hypothetical protein [Candidatus Neptunochlamydia vexilliferae]
MDTSSLQTDELEGIWKKIHNSTVSIDLNPKAKTPLTLIQKENNAPLPENKIETALRIILLNFEVTFTKETPEISAKIYQENLTKHGKDLDFIELKGEETTLNQQSNNIDSIWNNICNCTKGHMDTNNTLRLE